MHHAVRAVVLVVAAIAARPALAQVTDPATCGSTLPACTATRTSCCTRDFAGSSAAKAILIPLDRCHQVVANSGSDGPPSGGGSSPNWCADSPPTNVNSQNYAYGLVFRLMQAGIPVYWIVNPTKRPTTVSIINTTQTTKDIDFWVLSASATPPAPGSALTNLSGTAPIQRLTTTASLDLVVASSYSKNEFPVRGGAFLIAPEQRPAFEQFWKQRANRTTCGSSNKDCLDFRDVNLYEVDPSAKFAWQDFTQPLVAGKYVQNELELPVAMHVDYPPPRIARFYNGNTLSNWLKAANLDDAATNGAQCKVGADLVPANAIGCDVSEAEVQAGVLKSGNFNWAWVDIGTSGSCATTVAQLKDFMTAIPGTYTAGNVMFSNSGISLAENCGSSQILGRPGAGLLLGSTAITEGNGKPPFIIRYPNNLFAQYGDLPLDFANGTVAFWTRFSAANGNLYGSQYFTAPVTLRRLMSQESNTATAGNPYCNGADGPGARHDATSVANCDDARFEASADIIDMFAYARLDNNRNNGIAFYSPGANVTQNGNRAQLRMILSSLVATPTFTVEQVFSTDEVSRAAPVVATVDNKRTLVQGSYEYSYITRNGAQFQVPRTIPGIYTPDDVGQFTFPVQRGHVRAVATASIDTSPDTLAEGDVVFDAADKIPDVTFNGCGTHFTSSCRTIFTTVATGSRPANVFINRSNVAVLGPHMLPGFTGTQQQTLIDRVLKGFDTGTGFESALGGVDRSTVAVIGPGASVGGARPTIAYFGANDGMLHAVCASVTPPCDQLGRELWAYIPRVNLPSLRYNAARIDGSPRVLDVRGDFDGTGLTFRTVLVFHTGAGDPEVANETPAVYALDVTNPANPSVLWEYTIPNVAARDAFELGVGLSIAAGEVQVAGQRRDLAIVQTNNGGTAGPGTVVLALDIVTGQPLWKFGYKYPAPRTAGAPTVPATGIPGGVVSVDKSGIGTNGFMTDIVFGDLYGNLWVLDPATGESRYKDVLNQPTPVFSFSVDHRPIGAKPAIFARGGTQFAVFASGGYADPSNTTGWGTHANPQYVIAASLDTPTSGIPALPMTELTNSPHLPIRLALANDERAFSQIQIVGEELFLSTDSAVVNAVNYGTSPTASGRAHRINVITGQAGTSSTLGSGATSLVNDGTALFSSSGSKREQVGFSAAGTIGDAVNSPFETAKMVRKLWLVDQ
jgi:hypothetical protein